MPGMGMYRGNFLNFYFLESSLKVFLSSLSLKVTIQFISSLALIPRILLKIIQMLLKCPDESISSFQQTMQKFYYTQTYILNLCFIVLCTYGPTHEYFSHFIRPDTSDSIPSLLLLLNITQDYTGYCSLLHLCEIFNLRKGIFIVLISFRDCNLQTFVQLIQGW